MCGGVSLKCSLVSRVPKITRGNVTPITRAMFMKDYYGWIKLHRQIQNHWVYKIDGEYSKFHAWCDLLMNANFKQTKIVIKDTVIILEQGQQARSVLTLVKEWKWSKNKVLRFLELLKNDSMISVETNHLTTIITICNYSSFQLNDTAGDTPDDTAHETPCDTAGDTQYKNVKKVEKEKKKKSTLSVDELVLNGIDNQIAIDYLTIRKAKNLPLTETAFIAIITEGEKAKLSPNETLTKCVQKGWAGFEASWLTKE